MFPSDFSSVPPLLEEIPSVVEAFTCLMRENDVAPSNVMKIKKNDIRMTNNVARVFSEICHAIYQLIFPLAKQV